MKVVIPDFDFERTWWRWLFQERLVHTKFYIYIFIRKLELQFVQEGVYNLNLRKGVCNLLQTEGVYACI